MTMYVYVLCSVLYYTHLGKRLSETLSLPNGEGNEVIILHQGSILV